MDIQLVVFDWSGTVSDDRKPVYETYVRMAKKFNLEIMPFDEWKLAVGATAQDFFRTQGMTGDMTRLWELYEENFDVVSQSIMPTMYEDASDVFEYFFDRGKKIVILSAHPQKNVLKEANSYGLAYFTKKIVGSSFNKPDHLTSLCKELNVNPQNTIFVGDTTFDIHAAKEAGVLSVAVTTGYHSRSLLLTAKPDYIVPNLSGLKAII